MSRYYIIAGEASGDLHGGNLIRHIRQLDENAEIRAWGGDQMQAAGATLVKHYRDLAFMGFVEVVKHLGAILRNIAFCKKDILLFLPDVLVLIDYPGFNLRIAKWAKAGGIRVVYYISPQVWAWKEGRVKGIRASVDRMLVILPFEVAFYERWNFPVTYVGHPLKEVVQEAKAAPPAASLGDKPIIALLPGSRKMEIAQKLPVMLEVSKRFPEYRFIIAAAPSMDAGVYAALTAGYDVGMVAGDTYGLLRQARAALVTSGTATLETALFGVPQVVCYRGNSISYQIAKRLIRVKYISLVNLIMDAPVAPELIQNDLTEAKLAAALKPLAEDSPEREKMLAEYAQLWEKLAASGSASGKAAEVVVAVARA